MSSAERTYIAIDLKSFYASVECVERGLDPLTTNLVVADESRTEKTICLAVSPSLKAYGISGRARLFEAVQRIREVNGRRRYALGGRPFTGKSFNDNDIKAHPDWEIDFIKAPPRMAFYMEYSKRVREVYMKYIAPEDFFAYSIDEVFIDVTPYLAISRKTAHDFAMTIVRDVLMTTGITATAGIGSNMYLAKVAMDIKAKHMPADEYGVRVAELDEKSFRRELWNHRPLTDFWNVGHGIADRLVPYGIDTMGRIARCSIDNEALLYRLFGVKAELLIDHAWGWEPCTIADIKAYRPQHSSLSNGQVLTCPYTTEKALVVIMEMAEALALRLLDNGLATNQIVISIGYDVENITKSVRYNDDTHTDRYGRTVPKPSHGSINLDCYTSSAMKIKAAVVELFNSIVITNLLVRRLNIVANNLVADGERHRMQPIQLDLFTDYDEIHRLEQQERTVIARERRVQETILSLKKRFGKNSILKGLNFAEGATAKERNSQIGGHKA